jgi:molybdopterin-guanine dinucleotide biosynthesis protein A
MPEGSRTVANCSQTAANGSEDGGELEDREERMPPNPSRGQPPLPPLRCCLLSGGASRRMGRDKALLPHPEGGTWLERQLRLLAGLGAPLTLLSGWPGHLEQATAMAGLLASLGVKLELLPEARSEPVADPSQGFLVLEQPKRIPMSEQPKGMPMSEQPRGEPNPEQPEGPLVALGRLMEAHPEERLLLCPIDMPALTPSCLRALLEAASGDPAAIWIATAHQPQPLLGLYPSNTRHRQSLREALARGERGLQRWLAGEEVHTVALPAAALANVNTPQELDDWRAALTPPPDWPANRCTP